MFNQPIVRARLPRRMLALLAVLLGIAATVPVVTAGPASASATTCAWFGAGIRYGVRNGQFCAGINGSGTSINTVSGNFGTTIPRLNMICNPSIKLDVFDRWDHWITSRQGAQLSGCAWGSFYRLRSIPVYWSFPQADGGRLYVTLQSSGSPVAVVWFYFHS